MGPQFATVNRRSWLSILLRYFSGAGFATSRHVWRFRFENRAHSLPVERQMQSVFLRELRDLSFSIHLVYRPDALQFFLSNRAVMDSMSDFQLPLDLLGKNFHR